jgi:putative nucleotidyltransferase with HDIG domain
MINSDKEIEKGIAVVRWILLLMAAAYVLISPAGKSWNMGLLRPLLIGGAVYTLLMTLMLSHYRRSGYHYVGWILDLFFYSALVFLTGGSRSTLVFLFYALAYSSGAGQAVIGGLVGTMLVFLSCALIHVLGGRGPARTPDLIAQGCMIALSGWMGIGLPPFSSGSSDGRDAGDTDQLLEEAYRSSRERAKVMELRERELGEMTRKLETLMYLNHLMGSTSEMRELMETIVTRARDEMNCQIVFLMTIEEKRLKLAYSLGISDFTRNLLETPVEQGVLGSVAMSGKPVRMSDRDADSDFHEFVGSTEHFKNILCVPMITPQKKEIIGVLAVANTLSGEPFNRDQEEYLETLAGDASMFIRQMALLADLKIAYSNLEKAYLETVMALAQAVEARDKYTRGHIGRVRNYALKLARALKVPNNVLEIIAKAAILHDIGKIGTPDNILLKQGRLTEEEYAEMRKHAEQSAVMLKDLSSMPPEVVKLVRHHHERYDGQGYPDRLKGNEIPIGAQVIAVADVFDALTTDRPYRKGYPLEKALGIMNEASGSQFNPMVLNAFFKLFEEHRKNLQLNVEKEP